MEQQCAATQPQHAILEAPVRPLLQARSLRDEKGLGGQDTQAGGTQGASVWNVKQLRQAPWSTLSTACLQDADLSRSTCAVHHSKVGCLLLLPLRILSISLLRRPLVLRRICFALCVRAFLGCILQCLAPLPASAPDCWHVPLRKHSPACTYVITGARDWGA